MISHRIELSFYLLTGPIILSWLSHGGLQSWLGLHHPAVLGTPSAWGWQHPCPYPSVPGKAPSYSTRWSLACPWVAVLATCRPRHFCGVHLTLLPELVEFGALSLPFSLLSHPFPSPSPFFIPFPFSFPLFFSLPSLASCSFHAGEGENQPQPLICLISCSY